MILSRRPIEVFLVSLQLPQGMGVLGRDDSRR